MDNDFIRKHVLRYIPLGCSEEEAFLLAGCTEEQAEFLRNDAEFKKLVKLYVARETAKLLQAHRKASLLAAEKGSVTGLQWKLSKLNPSKFGNVDNSAPDKNSKLVIQFQNMTREELENMEGIDVYEGESDT